MNQGQEVLSTALERARSSLADVQKRAATMPKITDEASLQLAAESITISFNVQKALEIARKLEVDPLNAQVKAVNARYKAVAEPLAAIESDMKRKVDDYRAELKAQAERKAKAEALARAEAEALARAAEAKRAKEDQKAGLAPLPELPDDFFSKPTVPAVPDPLPPKQIQTTFGGLATRKSWVFEITDATLVPEIFKVVDERAIRKAVDNGAREIPGVHIHEIERTVNS
jgi:hypothetical protein